MAADSLSVSTVRHLVATLAYRASQVLRDAPDGFAEFGSGSATRRPVQIVAHMADLMAWALTLARGEYEWKAGGGGEWTHEVTRFFEGLRALDAELESDPRAADLEKLIQGPLADALTHVGQLAMLRGMMGAPVRPEAYARAAIARGQTGLEQPRPVREFDGDASERS